MVVTHFFATTGALTPADLFFITYRGSLIHLTRTSHHSVSNHLRFSTRRVPLPQRWPLYFVRASPCGRRLARTADRIEFTLSAHSDEHRYGLVVHFQLLSTRGYAPMQLLSVTGLAVSARSGTLTLLFQCALRRTTADRPGPQQHSWWKGSGMFQTTSTERRAAGGDCPRSPVGVSRCAQSELENVTSTYHRVA